MKLSKEWKSLFLLAVLSGALLGLAFPPIPTGLTAFVAFIPFLFMMERMKNAAQVFRFSYLTFLIFNIVTVYWISGWWGEDPWLKAAGVAVNLVHPFLFTLPSLVYYIFRKRAGLTFALAAFPFIWVAYEYLAHLPELSFPWLILANSQTFDIEKIQFIEYTGAFGASFWIVLVNVLIFFGFHRYLELKWKLWSKQVAALAIIVIAILTIPEVYSRIVLRQEKTGPTIKIGLAQPDVDPYEKWAGGETPLGKVQKLLILYDSIAVYADSRPDLVIFPETAIPFLILQPSYYDEWRMLRSHVDSIGIPLLTGFPDITWYENNAPPTSKKVEGSEYRYDTFNSTLLILPHERNLQIYHKIKLTPLSERIPYLDTFLFLQDMLSWGVGISSWGIGKDSTVSYLPHDGERIGIWAMICYETLYPKFVSTFAKKGAVIFSVITNDGWFGNSSGPYQLMQYTALRAIENRRAVARCANNGVSCFIDPYGRISQATDFGTRTWIAGELPMRSDLTFYAKHGDWFAQGCSIIAALFFFGALFFRKDTT